MPLKALETISGHIVACTYDILIPSSQRQTDRDSERERERERDGERKMIKRKRKRETKGGTGVGVQGLQILRLLLGRRCDQDSRVWGLCKYRTPALSRRGGFQLSLGERFQV